MPDGNHVVLEINGAPFQADGLAPAQTIGGAETDGDFLLIQGRSMDFLSISATSFVSIS